MTDNSDGMSGKEAFFALDTSFDDDMEAIKREATLLTIKHINSTPKLYELVKGKKYIQQTCIDWAFTHGDEFGELFISELDMVDWAEVKRSV